MTILVESNVENVKRLYEYSLSMGNFNTQTTPVFKPLSTTVAKSSLLTRKDE